MLLPVAFTHSLLVWCLGRGLAPSGGCAGLFLGKGPKAGQPGGNWISGESPERL